MMNENVKKRHIAPSADICADVHPKLVFIIKAQPQTTQSSTEAEGCSISFIEEYCFDTLKFASSN